MVVSTLKSSLNTKLLKFLDQSTKLNNKDHEQSWFFLANSKLYKYAKEYGTTWDFEYIDKVDAHKKTDNCIEYRVKLSCMDNLSSILNLKVVLLNKNWNEVYQIPETQFAVLK